MYILYGGRYTRAATVQMVLAEGDIDYELRSIDILNGEHRSAAFRDINPAGLVPALITPEGDQLCETPAIGLYLAERHGLTHLVPAIDDPQRGAFLSALFYITDELEPELKRYFYPERYSLRRDDDAAIAAQALERAQACFSVIESRLAAEGPFLLGDRMSLADLTLAFWVACLPPSDRPKGSPAVLACAKLVAARPKLGGVFKEIAAWRDDYADLAADG